MLNQEFIDHVKEQAGLTDEQAARAVQAVFSVLRRKIPEETIEKIMPLLPGEFRAQKCTCAEHEKHEGAEGHAVHPPAEERVDIIPPPGEYEATEGSGSEIHYRSDPQLEEEIKTMLRESPNVHAEKIQVFVLTGNVALRGVVESVHERDEAGMIAAKALGVGEILNELSVEEERAA